MHGDVEVSPNVQLPHLGEQLPLWLKGLARVPHEEDQQVVLPRGQLDQVAVDPDFVGGKVYHSSPSTWPRGQLVRQARPADCAAPNAPAAPAPAG